MENEDVFDYAGASRLTGLGRATLRSLVARRQIPFIRLGRRIVRFRRHEIEAWLDRHAVPERAPSASTVLPVTEEG